MKFATVSKSVVMGLALLLASSAFAATKASLTLQSSATINGAKLKPGDYKLEWEGSGPNVEVSIIRSEEHTSELQSLRHIVCRLLLVKKKKKARTENLTKGEAKQELGSECSVVG